MDSPPLVNLRGLNLETSGPNSPGLGCVYSNSTASHCLTRLFEFMLLYVLYEGFLVWFEEHQHISKCQAHLRSSKLKLKPEPFVSALGALAVTAPTLTR